MKSPKRYSSTLLLDISLLEYRVAAEKKGVRLCW
jgi:hypothetical protein